MWCEMRNKSNTKISEWVEVLVTPVGKMEPSCPLGTTRLVPKEKFPQKPYNKSFIDQACSLKMAWYWPRSFFACLWTSTSSRSINTQKKNSASIQLSWPHTWSITHTYSCFDKGCPTKLKHTPQCWLIVIVYHYWIKVQGVSASRKEIHVYTCLRCCFFFYHAEIPSSFSQDILTTITHNTFRHCRVRFSASSCVQNRFATNWINGESINDAAYHIQPANVNNFLSLFGPKKIYLTNINIKTTCQH